MAPINLPNGNEVSEIVLPNGATASEVVAPDGSTVFGNAAPDSVVYNWVTPIGGLSNGDLVGTWTDGVGAADITGNGITYATDALNGSIDAVSGDGTDDYGDTNSTLPDWSGSFVSADRAFVIGFQSSAFIVRNPLFGVHATSTGSVLTIRPDEGEIQLRVRDDDGNRVVYETAAGPFDDGNYHLLILNKIGSDPTNWEWHEVTNGTSSQLADNIASTATLTTFSTDLDFYTHARNNAGSPSNYQTIDIGSISLANAALTQAEREKAPYR